ncbi:MAG: hypothetical protein FWG69_03640, partial [Oscillospiraceae bacterium]|nr:hypothetical protein [Oscillospiraceae bacterium]
LSCAVKNSPWAEYAEDIVATSGFAFRMWVSADLCPSATSIWSFDDQKPWIENSGLTCGYVGRYWGQDDIEEQKRLEAIANIKKSIDNGIPAVSWDICVCEWGLIIGYDDNTQTFAVLGVSGEGKMSYKQLGKRELPLLSVLTVTGKSDKSQKDILYDTKKLAVLHLKGGEWCDNAKGLEAYPALIRHFEDDFSPDRSWNMEYFLGTFGALKYYTWKYFEKMEQTELAAIYKTVYDIWQEAFQIKKGQDVSQPEIKAKIAAMLRSAHRNEIKAVEVMEKTMK